jgi:hypothetical protein
MARRELGRRAFGTSLLSVNDWRRIETKAQLAEDLHQRPANLASLFHHLDGAGPLVHNLIDGLGDCRWVIVATEKDIAANEGAADVRPRGTGLNRNAGVRVRQEKRRANGREKGTLCSPITVGLAKTSN